jgi:hypothetical protein
VVVVVLDVVVVGGAVVVVVVLDGGAARIVGDDRVASRPYATPKATRATANAMREVRRSRAWRGVGMGLSAPVSANGAAQSS